MFYFGVVNAEYFFPIILLNRNSTFAKVQGLRSFVSLFYKINLPTESNIDPQSFALDSFIALAASVCYRPFTALILD